jgi:CheY-like chemotaxis protein
MQTNQKISQCGTSPTVPFLVVDDDEVDVLSIQRAFKKLDVNAPIAVANNGLEALEFLRGQNGRNKLKQPYLILLDLNMPKMNGIEFLEEIRGDEELKRSIVFVLTTSSDQNDLARAYDLNVAGYIVKSDATKTFSDTLGLLNQYRNLVELPRG